MSREPWLILPKRDHDASPVNAADLRPDRAWLSKVGAGLDSLRRAGLVLALLMAVAAVTVVAVLLLWGGFAASSVSWGPQLAAALEGLDPQFLPARFCGLLVAGFAASRHAV